MTFFCNIAFLIAYSNSARIICRPLQVGYFFTAPPNETTIFSYTAVAGRALQRAVAARAGGSDLD